MNIISYFTDQDHNCCMVCLLSPYFLHTQTYTRSKNHPLSSKQWTMVTSFGWVRLIVFRCGIVFSDTLKSFIWQQLKKNFCPQIRFKEENNTCQKESGLSCSQYIQEVLTATSEERNLWWEEPHSAKTVPDTVRLWDVSENIEESSYK